jgi:hypothetical protein
MIDILQVLTTALASAFAAGGFVKFFAEKSIEAGIEKALHKEKLLTETELQYRKRQLEEFYGPIYAALKLSARIHPLWLAHHFQDVNKDVIALFKKQNDEITTILKTKAHLIDEGGWPPQFTRFMTSTAIWGVYCTREHEPWIPDRLRELKELQWPNEFQEHIFAKTEQLKSRLDALMAKYKAT